MQANPTMTDNDKTVALRYLANNGVLHFLYQPGGLDSASIQFVSLEHLRHGDKIIEDNEAALACIRYLKSSGSPSFNKIRMNDLYAKLLIECLQRGLSPAQARKEALEAFSPGDFAD